VVSVKGSEPPAIRGDEGRAVEAGRKGDESAIAGERDGIDFF
jgi:hypothetical protein